MERSERTRAAITGLYPIIDTTYVGTSEIKECAEVIARSGVNVLQLRGKGLGSKELLRAAEEVREVTLKAGISFIVNDRVDVALMVGADGVHLGQSDLPISEARSLLGKEKIIGLSCHNVAEAKEAAKLSADYISIGPIFKTRTKGDAEEPKGTRGLSEVAEIGLPLPVVAIGGISAVEIPELLGAGTNAVAIISEILLSENMAETLSAIIKTIRR
ncbi:MAG: thiamine phosphate synthase [Thermodesulfobacteriota bacterium]